MKSFELKGDDFAKATDPSSILYNGPYLLKSIVTKSSVEFAKIRTTGIRIMCMLTKLNCHSGMVKILVNLQKTLKMVALQQLVSIQQVQVSRT